MSFVNIRAIAMETPELGLDQKQDIGSGADVPKPEAAYFTYKYIIDTFNFSFLVNENCLGSFLITKPEFKADDLIAFLDALDKKTSASIEIKSDTAVSYMITTKDGFCEFHDKFEVFIYSMKIRISHAICLEMMKKFVQEMLDRSKQSDPYQDSEPNDMSEFEVKEIPKVETKESPRIKRVFSKSRTEKSDPELYTSKSDSAKHKRKSESKPKFVKEDSLERKNFLLEGKNQLLEAKVKELTAKLNNIKALCDPS